MSDVASLDVTRYARRWRRHWTSSRVVALLALMMAAWPALFIYLHLIDFWDQALAVMISGNESNPARTAAERSEDAAFLTAFFDAARRALDLWITYPIFGTAVLLVGVTLFVIGSFRYGAALAGLALLGLIAVLLCVAVLAFLLSADPIGDAVAVAERPPAEWFQVESWAGLLLSVLMLIAAVLFVWQAWLLWHLGGHRPADAWPRTRLMTRSLGANLGFAGGLSWRRLSLAGIAVQAAVAATVVAMMWLYGFAIAQAVGLGLLVLGQFVLSVGLMLVGVLFNAVRLHWPLVTIEAVVELFVFTPKVLLMLGVCAGALALAAVWRYGERLNRRRRDRLILAGAKPPVLLLRSFADDVTGIRPNSLLKRLFLRRKRLEECLGEELWRAGPFIAVGRPGETLPPLGAERVYLPDDQWQGAVKSFIDRSELIILIAGTTHWVRWELASTLEQSRLTRLLVVFPPSRPEERAVRWENLKAPLASTPWAAAAAAVDIADTLALFFQPDGRIVQVRSRRAAESDYEAAVRVATYVMARTALAA